MNSNPNPPTSGPWRFRNKPALVAHRGFAQLFPENTLTALAAAVDAGAAFVEFDIQLSKDLVPFLMHDPDLQRTAGVDQSVFELTMDQLMRINVGEHARLGGRFGDVKPTTLEHACTHLNAWSDVHSFVEVKRQSIERFGLETVMQKIFDAVSSLEAPFTILSFREDVVEYTQQHSDFSAGWVIRHWNEESLATLARLSPEFVFCSYTDVPAEEPIPSGPWSWVLYEITDTDTASFWRQRGIHMIESMTVARMLDSHVFKSE